MPFDIQGKEIIDDPSFNTDDLIKIVDADRQKIRSLSQAVLVVCGFLITAIFGITYVLLKDRDNTPAYIILLFIIVVIVVFFSLSKSIKSMRVSSSDNCARKGDFLASLNEIMADELNHSNFAIVCLHLSMIGFIFVMVLFFINYYDIYSICSRDVFYYLVDLIEFIHFVIKYVINLITVFAL